MKKIIRALIFLMVAIAATPKMYAQVDVGVGVGVDISTPPPELPEYDQPECPGDGYIWTPGYWAYGDDGYFWVPGVWVEAPEENYYCFLAFWGFVFFFFFFFFGCFFFFFV